ncbi:MAG: hypothetical protein ACHQ49_03100 [Elusimicrobiota bacterium]
MSDQSDERAAAIADLLARLADLSGDDSALEACRREADAFEPSFAAAGIALDILALETAPEGLREARALLERLRGQFLARGEIEVAAKVDAGLASFEGAGGRP